MMWLVRWIFCVWFGLMAPLAFAKVDAQTLLKADEAFQARLISLNQGLSLQFSIAEGYYLYRDKIQISSEAPALFGETLYAPSQLQHDHFFGDQYIYRHVAQIDLPYQDINSLHFPLKIHISYQGCADAGICYPPTQKTFSISHTGVFTPLNQSIQTRFSTWTKPSKSSSRDRAFELSYATLGANLMAFFLAGLALSLTACMYPLLPIISSVVLGQNWQAISKKQAFVLALVYVQGLALTYTAVGVAAGLTGALLTVWLQTPWVIAVAAFIMVLLALSMFGLFSLQLPLSWQQFLNQRSMKLSGGRMLSVFLMGMFSALIVGPCVAPPLAFALGYIGRSADAFLGGLALYVLALGMGVPLILVTVFGAHFLPKAGGWMRAVPVFFGCLLLAATVYMLTPYLPYNIALAAYTLIMLIPGGLLWVKARTHHGIARIVAQSFAMILVLSSLLFAYSGSFGRYGVAQRFLSLIPEDLVAIDKNATFHSPQALTQTLQAALKADPSRPVFVDLYADWCVACKEMAAEVYNQEDVWQVIDKERFFVLDVTDNNPEIQAFLRQHQLFGPPALLVFHADHRPNAPLIGYTPKEDLIRWVKQHISQ